MQEHDNIVTGYEMTGRWTKTALGLVLVGVAGLVGAWLSDPARVWANLLVNSFYFVSVPLLCTLFVAILYLVGARWSEAVRRIPEAVMKLLPVGAVLMLLILGGIHSVYHWSHAEAVQHDALLKLKSPYLNFGFYAARMVVFFVVWILLSRALLRNSRREDADGSLVHRRRNTVWASIFTVIFAYTFSLASIDWIMSLEPHWFSTMFAVYTFSGAFLSALVVVTLLALHLKASGRLQALNENHFHDLGKLVFAFVFFWGYIWFCQFMLIWYGNIPEETAYFNLRMSNNWDWFFFTNLILNFALPFLLLLPRGSKRNPRVLRGICLLLLAAHWLDVYLLVMPGVTQGQAFIGWVEVAIALGYAGLFLFAVGKALEKTPLLPLKSPLLAESLHYHQ